jgi:hypothetical protein
MSLRDAAVASANVVRRICSPGRDTCAVKGFTGLQQDQETQNSRQK